MRKALSIAISIILSLTMLFTLSACGKKNVGDKPSESTAIASDGTTAGTSGGTQSEGEGTGETGDNEGTAGEDDNLPSQGGLTGQELLNSASVDLDSDGANEEIEAFQYDVLNEAGQPTDEIEGLLVITGKNGTVKTPFQKKAKGLSGLMTGMEFEDLDGDGVKDIFITIPGEGASYSLNFFYIYNYKTGASISFNSDETLFSLANSFAFKYKGGGKLAVINQDYGFTGTIDVSDSLAFEADEASNGSYDSSYVEPVPVEISAESRIELVRSSDGKTEIKVPFPIFGHGTVDLIGEVDIYYTLDGSFTKVMKRAEVMDMDSKTGLVSRIGTIKF
jgi:hypothetical protein